MSDFTGLLNNKLKTLFNDSITELLTACAEACTLVYSGQFEDCTNCSADAIGNKSSNHYISGAPIPLHQQGVCPACNGSGKRQKEVSPK